jgi:hypothetical protein
VRRQPPPGGTVPQDYEFEEGAEDLDGRETIRRVKLSELFRRPNGSLVMFSFMYGPKMLEPCRSCTSILHALNGTAPHVAQCINPVVVAKSPMKRIWAFACHRTRRLKTNPLDDLGSQVISVLLFCHLSRYARILAIRTILRPKLHGVTRPQPDHRLRIRGHILHGLAYPIAHLEDLPARECFLG